MTEYEKFKRLQLLRKVFRKRMYQEKLAEEGYDARDDDDPQHANISSSDDAFIAFVHQSARVFIQQDVPREYLQSIVKRSLL